MLIEPNIAILTFYSTSQWLANGYFSIDNKLNIITCTLFLFVTLIYSTSFYPLIYLSEKKSSAESLLCHSKYHLKSYYLESFCFLLRSFIRGCIQGIGFQSYYYQLIALCISDLFFVLITIVFKDKFIHKLVGFFLMMFNLGFLLLDIVLFYQFKDPTPFETIDFNFFIFLILGAIIFFYLSIIGTILIRNIYITIKSI